MSIEDCGQLWSRYIGTQGVGSDILRPAHITPNWLVMYVYVVHSVIVIPTSLHHKTKNTFIYNALDMLALHHCSADGLSRHLYNKRMTGHQSVITLLFK